jgi:hypothetical protein
MAPMTNEQPDTPISDALARMRRSVDIPRIDPARERALLAAFDAHWSGPQPALSSGAWQAAAALVAMTLVINWLVVATDPRTGAGRENEVVDHAEFVAWPGADARPPFESGSVVRVDLPVSALSALGLPAPLSTATVVQAEVVVAQDGFARAVRIVQ